jgi:hypothetical protein
MPTKRDRGGGNGNGDYARRSAHGEAVQRDEGWDYCAFYPSQSLINDVAETVLKGRGDVNFGTEGMRHDPRIARRMLHAAQVLNASDDPLEKACVMYQILNILIGNYGERTVKGARQDVMRADIRKAIEFCIAVTRRR